MKKPTRLPPLEIVEPQFGYDPITGEILKNGKPYGSNDRTSGERKVRCGGRVVNAARLAWLLFYRVDPINKKIEHINGIPTDNRIDNLRAVKL